MKENYFAGMDCTCSAYGESECGCGVDWTDARIYKLQAEIAKRDSRIAILEKLMNAVDECGNIGDVGNQSWFDVRNDYQTIYGY